MGEVIRTDMQEAECAVRRLFRATGYSIVCACGCESCSLFFDDLIETFSDDRVRWTTLFVSYYNRKKKKITLTNLLKV